MLPQSSRLQRRTNPVRAIIVHTTGAGLAKKDDPYGWYVSSGFKYYGSDLVLPNGDHRVLATPDLATMHTARLSSRYLRDNWREWSQPPPRGSHRANGLVAHGRDGHVVYDWWDERWGKTASPMDLATATRSINANTIGVDIVPMREGGFSPESVHVLGQIIRGHCEAAGIPCDESHVLGHEDVDPYRRGTLYTGSGKIIGRGWDPRFSDGEWGIIRGGC